MSHLSDVGVQILNLEADIESLKRRIEVERDISNYWYKRSNEAETRERVLVRQINDALDD